VTRDLNALLSSSIFPFCSSSKSLARGFVGVVVRPLLAKSDSRKLQLARGVETRAACSALSRPS
jgi:hypothetical protein